MNARAPRLLASLLACAVLVASWSGCAPQPTPPAAAPPAIASEAPAPDPLAAAIAEATAIVRAAQATAVVRSARETAAALEGAPPGTARPASTPVKGATAAPSTPAPVEILGANLAGGGGLISIEFRAPVDVARAWYPGNVYVVDEASGAVFNEVPTMAVIGPLITRPKVEGQIGYVMLVNAPPYLRPGAQVTIVLGSFRQEHVSVR